MSLFSILIALVIVGVLLWLANTYIPMDKKIKKILNVVVVIVVILWLLSVFGVFGSQSGMHTSSMNIGSLHMRW
jgi:formate hydrogenlyase subunit 4